MGAACAALAVLTGCGGTAVSPPQPARVAFLSDRTGDLDIYVVNFPGGSPVNISNHSAGDDGHSWSPTGNQLAFVSNRTGDWELYTVNVNGTGLVQRTSDALPKGRTAWSPAGNLIAYECGNDIYVYNLTTNTTTNLTGGNGNNIHPSWSPSGAQIAFASDRAGSWDIWVMDANGSNVTQLTSDAAPEQRPVWSPNGAQIAFERGSDVWVMNANGSSPINLTSGLSTGGRWPTWSPNSQKVAFESNNDIYTVNADGSGLTQITTTGDCFGPHWSKDYGGNSYIVFIRIAGGAEVYVMTPTGTGMVNISNHPAVDEGPFWAP